MIGAGAGLSASAGFEYSGDRFKKYFSDFEERYGFHDMYSGGFYPYDTLEEYWAYWSRYILINRYEDAPKPAYEKLFRLVREREYFVLTTNVDHCFQKAGFDKMRLFYTQGDYGLWQCAIACHEKTYDNETQVRRMVAEQQDMKIPSTLVPYCPVCGAPMTMNLRCDNTFVQDYGWYAAHDRYEEFVCRNQDKNLLLLELGVGYNTPVIIKYPFWQMAAQNSRAVYACINSGETSCPQAIRRRSICIGADVYQILNELESV